MRYVHASNDGYIFTEDGGAQLWWANNTFIKDEGARLVGKNVSTEDEVALMMDLFVGWAKNENNPSVAVTVCKHKKSPEASGGRGGGGTRFQKLTYQTFNGKTAR
jgi:hypothetical protein